MWYLLLSFAALLFTALALAPAAAHVMELPAKIKLKDADYLIAQRLYRGWHFVGIVVAAALLTTLALTLVSRTEPWVFAAALAAFFCIAGTQAIFWSLTFPVNRATANWSMLPANWRRLRRRWEFSHAASALLNLAALVAVILAVLWSRAP